MGKNYAKSLRDKYTDSKQVLEMLSLRYGLNQLGIKKLLDFDGKRFNKLMVKGEQLSEDEKLRVLELFQELEGRI